MARTGAVPKDDELAKAAGYIGAARRYGHDPSEARQLFETIKLERCILKLVPTFTPEQQQRISTAVAAAIAEA